MSSDFAKCVDAKLKRLFHLNFPRRPKAQIRKALRSGTSEPKQKQSLYPRPRLHEIYPSEKRGRPKRSSMTSAATTSMAWGHRLLSTSQAVLTCASRNRSTWRWSDVTWNAAHPNKKHHLSHRKHWFPVHTYGVQRESYLRCVDVSICCKSIFQDQE